MASSRLPEDPLQRQLKIKLGVVQRTQRELAGYHAELAQQKAKVERMRAAAADEYDIKKQVEVQAESEMMIPDTMRRLAKGVEELRGFVDSHSKDAAVAGSAPLLAAAALIAELAVEDAEAAAEDDGPI